MVRRFRAFLNNLPRAGKRLLLLTFDIVALGLAVWLSFSLRLGADFNPSPRQIMLLALAPLVAVPIFVRFGLYRAVIRYLPERAIWTVLQAMLLATLVWVFLLFLAEAIRIGVLPRLVPLFYFFLGSVLVGGSRFAAKYFLLPRTHKQTRAGEVVIYGAGAAGTQLANALRGEGAHAVVGFLDDDKTLHGQDVSGIRVYPPGRLESLIRDEGVREVILSLPSVDAARRRELVAALSKYPVAIRTLPAISDLASGKYLVSQLRQIDISDLLGRSSVPADPGLLSEMIAGRSVLVSGAGGSIGAELVKLIVEWKPKVLVLFEANEFALYQIERKLMGENGPRIVPVLGSVTDDRLVRRTLSTYAVEAVFHAAAHKHVPLLESNALEGVRNNVLGTQTIAEACQELGVENFVLISTDKAVRPTNVMGATKRWAELIVGRCGAKAVAEKTGQRFCAVRFGNVLGSNGSVVPLFSEQITRGGPVTLTDERMTRYFMSIHEAAELIVQAGGLSEGGDVFLLDMGEPVRIRDLAENMIRLAGLKARSSTDPEGDIDIIETGIRPGEKLYEELFYDPALAQSTRQPKILKSQEPKCDRDLEAALSRLEAGLLAEDEAATRAELFGLIEG